MIFKNKKEFIDYIKDYGTKSTSGFGKNVINIFEINELFNIVVYNFNQTGTCYVYTKSSNSKFRYNETRDAIQFWQMSTNYYGRIEYNWRDVPIKDNMIICTTKEEAEEYKNVYTEEHKDIAIKNIQKTIKEYNSDIKVKQKEIKRLEKTLLELSKEVKKC